MGMIICVWCANSRFLQWSPSLGMTRRSPATSLRSLVTRLAWHILCGRSRSLAPVSKLCQRKQLLWNVPLRKQLLLFSKLKNATWLFYPHIWSLSFPNQIIICLWYGLMGMKCNHLVWFCAELHKKETCEPVTILRPLLLSLLDLWRTLRPHVVCVPSTLSGPSTLAKKWGEGSTRTGARARRRPSPNMP